MTGFNNWLSRDPQIIETDQYELRIASNPDRASFTWLLGFSYFDAEFNSQFSGGEVIVGGDGGISLFGTFDAAFDLDVDLRRASPMASVPAGSRHWIRRQRTAAKPRVFSAASVTNLTSKWSYSSTSAPRKTRSAPRPLPFRQSFPFIEPFVIGPGEIGLELGQDFDAFLPRFTVQYQPTDTTLNVWVTYSEGNNPGLFQPGFDHPA